MGVVSKSSDECASEAEITTDLQRDEFQQQKEKEEEEKDSRQDCYEKESLFTAE
jgi:hypothetical protein